MKKRKRKLILSPFARKPLKDSAPLGERAPSSRDDPLGYWPHEKKRKRKKGKK